MRQSTYKKIKVQNVDELEILNPKFRPIPRSSNPSLASLELFPKAKLNLSALQAQEDSFV